MLSGFSIVWQQRDAMASGLLTTLEISIAAGLLAAVFGTLIFSALISRVRFIRWGASGLVDLMRCVPFMLFCYLMYYGLPYAGIMLGNFTVGVVSLSIYHASYMAELLRGAWKEMPKDTVEGGIRLRLSRLAFVADYSAATGHHCNANTGQRVYADHQGQCLSGHHRGAGTDLCGE